MLKRQIIFFLIVGLGLTSCSQYQKLLKSNDTELKYEKAVGYYESEDYYKALQLFDLVIPAYRGTEKAERLNYYYAQCYYKQKDYSMASYYFMKFAKEYPRSENAEECYFLSAYCKYLDSPDYSKDQTSTYDALNDLQAFANAYPNSARVKECNDLMNDLRAKLEKKQYSIATMYLKMSDYQAAVTTYNNLLKEYPDTEYREEAMLGLIEANYLYASKSVASKQQERYQAAVEAYDRYRANYPDSKNADEAEAMYLKARKALSLN